MIYYVDGANDRFSGAMVKSKLQILTSFFPLKNTILSAFGIKNAIFQGSFKVLYSSSVAWSYYKFGRIINLSKCFQVQMRAARIKMKGKLKVFGAMELGRVCTLHKPMARIIQEISAMANKLVNICHPDSKVIKSRDEALARELKALKNAAKSRRDKLVLLHGLKEDI